MKATAVFLDRDDTIIEDHGYISDPTDVRLLPGAVAAIRRFADAGHLVVLVSNQSGVARGLLSEADLERVHARLEELLRARGAHLDAAYYCPFLDGEEAVVEQYRRNSDLRKPEPGMLLQAARDLDIDLSRSWMIGDSQCDIDAGRRAGCHTILIVRNDAPIADPLCEPTCTVRSLTEAADLLEREMTNQDDVKLTGERATADNVTQDAEVLRVLENIHDELERANRLGRQKDFSLLRLFGALVQMFAVTVGIWGALAVLEEESAQATARLTLACFLQLAAIAAFAVDRFR
ncbi:MAG: D-glycero-alpha-D-manno-heptose-1,7-bisphosphate 7-phosphatase [Phycisphaerae bacterium]